MTVWYQIQDNKVQDNKYIQVSHILQFSSQAPRGVTAKYEKQGKYLSFYPMRLGSDWYEIGYKTCCILKIIKSYVEKGHLNDIKV